MNDAWHPSSVIRSVIPKIAIRHDNSPKMTDDATDPLLRMRKDPGLIARAYGGAFSDAIITHLSVIRHKGRKLSKNSGVEDDGYNDGMTDDAVIGRLGAPP